MYVTPEGLRIWSIDSFDSTVIPGTVGAMVPFFSPDGQQVAYVDGTLAGPLKRISVNGGPSGQIVEAVVNPIGARWMENGEILFPNNGIGIMSVPATGGEPTVIVEETAQMLSPQLLPDGKHILFSLNPTTVDREIVVQNLEDGTRRTLASGLLGSYLESGESGGHLVFFDSEPTSQYLAVALDQNYNPLGSPFPMIDQIQGGIPKVAVSASGTVVYESGQGGAGLGSVEAIRTLAWVTPDGKETPIPIAPDNYRWARVSPTGDRVAVQVGFQIWIWNVRNQNFARLPDFGKPMETPVWTPDGERIIFRTTSNEGSDEGPAFYSIAADGSGEFLKVIDLPENGSSFPYNFTPDGSAMLAALPGPTGPQQAFAIPMGSDWVASGEPRQLRQSDLQVVEATVHPGGEWMAFAVLAGGTTPRISFSPYPDAGRQEIPVGSFAQPVFSPSGDVLYMANAGQGLFSVDVDTSDGLKLGMPELLIPNNYYWGAQGRAWDYSPDGRFLLMKPVNAGAAPVEVEESPKLRVVVNWVEELKRLVPLP